MGELNFQFDAQKTAQAVAFLLRLSHDKKKSKGHLVKMLYGADKRQIRKGGIPLTGDEPYSMPNGPVLSNVLDLFNGKKKDAYWDRFVSKATSDTHLVSLLDDRIGEDLLSDSEKDSLRVAWSVFGHLSWPQVKDLSHKIFPEWEDTGRSRKRIEFESIYKIVGHTPGMASEMAAQQKEGELVATIFGNAKTR